MSNIGRMLVLTAVLAVSAGLLTPAEATTKKHHTSHQVRMVERPLPLDVQLVQFNNKDLQLRAQIASQIQTGQLTHWQSVSLITMLDQIKATQNNYLSKGFLTVPERDALVAAYASMNHQITAATNSPQTRLDPSAMGFNLPNMGYPHGMYLPPTERKQIGAVQPWWMY